MSGEIKYIPGATLTFKINIYCMHLLLLRHAIASVKMLDINVSFPQQSFLSFLTERKRLLGHENTAEDPTWC